MKGSSRPTIGLQVPSLTTEYPKLLWRGVADAAVEKDCNCVIFHGESPNSPVGYNYQYSVIYDFIGPKCIDALIMATGTLCNFIGAEEFRGYIHRFGSIPLVSVSIPLEGVPSLLIDNKNGIIEAVGHLALVHRRRRIAFIRGPRTNFEAETRFEAYCEALTRFGLALDVDLVVDGNFMEDSAVPAVGELLDGRRVRFDALMACNDNMAIGALKELHRRGIAVPEDVSVFGFDNIQDCENVTPALSTIKQPVYLQARKAVDLALDMIAGREVPPSLTFPTTIFTRSSCGCVSESLSDAGLSTDDREPVWNGSSLDTGKNGAEDWKTEAVALLESTDFFGPRIAETIMTAERVMTILEGITADRASEEGLFHILSKDFAWRIHHGHAIAFWRELLGILFRHAASRWTSEKAAERARSLRRNLLSLIQDNVNAMQIADRLQLEGLDVTLWAMLNHLLSLQTIDDVLSHITEYVDGFGIGSCFIIGYDRPVQHFRGTDWVMPAKAEILLAYDRGRNLKEIRGNRVPVDPTELVPRALLEEDRRRDFIVMPIFFFEEQYGYVLFELGIRWGSAYDFLAMGISNAFRNYQILLKREEAERMLKKVLRELEESNKRLYNLSETDELTGLYNRRGFFNLTEHNLSLAQRMKKNGILFFADLDGLKTINDTHGHDAGDDAIRAAGELLRKTFRSMDVIARLGGDEFTVFTMDTEPGFIDTIRERLMTRIAAFNGIAGTQFQLSMSLGAAPFRWNDNQTLTKLMADADERLYHEKQKRKEARI